MKSNLYLFAFLVLNLCACRDQSHTPTGSTRLEQWQNLKANNYTIDQVLTCECLTGGQTARLTVKNNSIVSAVWTSNGAPLEEEQARWYYTVDQLFAKITDPTVDSVVVEYHATQGYPETLDIDPQKHPVDGGVLITTSNLKVLD